VCVPHLILDCLGQCRSVRIPLSSPTTRLVTVMIM
jgi:hypothetical protein